MDSTSGIQLRGYRRVFRVERRLFRLDRWRLPYPHGVPVRGIAYFLVVEFTVLGASRLPLLGALLGIPHPALIYLGLPLAGAFALLQGRIDGRPPHHVLASLIGHAARPKWLAGLAPCPRPGEDVEPLAEVQVAYDAREAFVVRGRIRGPAKVTFRYPSVVAVQAPPWVRDPEARRAKARRYRVRRRPGAPPMLRGKVVHVPEGREVFVE